MPPREEDVRAEMNKVDQGAPIPTIEVALAKRLWKAVGPLPPNVANAVGTDTLTAQQFVAQLLRGPLLTSLIARRVLSDFNDEASMEKAIAAAATFPCTKDDVAEAMLLFHLTQVSPEEARRAKVAMKAEGLDMDVPKVDGRFIQWMKDNG